MKGLMFERLAPGLGHAVEVAAVEVEAAHHGADGAVLRRQGDEAACTAGRLMISQLSPNLRM